MEKISLGEYTAGEIPAPFTYTFRDALGAPIKLQGGWQSKFVFVPKGATEPVIERDAVPAADQDAHPGDVTWVWADGDMDTAGNFWGDLWVGDGQVRLAAVRLTWKVNAAVAPAPAI